MRSRDVLNRDGSTIAEFPEVRPLDCPEDSSYAELCMPLWPTVAEELA